MERTSKAKRIMSETEDALKGFEWFEIPPEKQFFDQLEKRIFVNFTKRPMKVGFSHTARMVELIAISEDVKEDPELTALEGVNIEEE